MSAAQTTKKTEFRPSIPRRLRSVVGQSGTGTAYRREFARVALGAALLGATAADLAGLFDVSEQTIHNWRAVHPAFRKAIQEGSEFADANVARGLYRRATGYATVVTSTETREQRDTAGVLLSTTTIITIEQRHIPADPTAAWRWLGLRCGWRLLEGRTFDEVCAVIDGARAEAERRGLDLESAVAAVDDRTFLRCPTCGGLNMAGVDGPGEADAGDGQAAESQEAGAPGANRLTQCRNVSNDSAHQLEQNRVTFETHCTDCGSPFRRSGQGRSFRCPTCQWAAPRQRLRGLNARRKAEAAARRSGLACVRCGRPLAARPAGSAPTRAVCWRGVGPAQTPRGMLRTRWPRPPPVSS
jgi:hypothetical protein